MAAWVRANWVFLTFLGLLAAGFILLRSKPSNIGTLPELDSALTAGQPTVVEFYSNF